jgi:hypothetical protein
MQFIIGKLKEKSSRKLRQLSNDYLHSHKRARDLLSVM